MKSISKLTLLNIVLLITYYLMSMNKHSSSPTLIETKVAHTLNNTDVVLYVDDINDTAYILNRNFKSVLEVGDRVTVELLGAGTIIAKNDTQFELELDFKDLIHSGISNNSVFDSVGVIGKVSSVKNGVLTCITLK